LESMVRRLLAIALLVTTLASARGGDELPVGFRLGFRAGPSEFTPQLGLLGRVGNAYASVDGWYQPFRFRITEKGMTYMVEDVEPIKLDVQFRERRWGFTPGLHYDLGSRNFGIVPGAGWEWSWGNWEGDDLLAPPMETVGWVDLELRILPYNHLGVKYYPSDTRSGSWKIEYVAQFGGPKH